MDFLDAYFENANDSDVFVGFIIIILIIFLLWMRGEDSCVDTERHVAR